MTDGPFVVLHGPCYTAVTQPGIDVLREVYKDAIKGHLICMCGYENDVLYTAGEAGRGLKVFMIRAICPECRREVREEITLGEGGWKRVSRQELDRILRLAPMLRGGLP